RVLGVNRPLPLSSSMRRSVSAWSITSCWRLPPPVSALRTRYWGPAALASPLATCWRAASLPTSPVMRTLLPSTTSSPARTCCRSGPSIATIRSPQPGGAITAPTSLRSTTRAVPYSACSRPSTATRVASSGTVAAAITGRIAAAGAGTAASCASAGDSSAQDRHSAARRMKTWATAGRMSGSQEGFVEIPACKSQRQIVVAEEAGQAVERVIAIKLVLHPVGIGDPDDLVFRDLGIERSVQGARVRSVEADQQSWRDRLDTLLEQQHQFELGAPQEPPDQVQPVRGDQWPVERVARQWQGECLVDAARATDDQRLHQQPQRRQHLVQPQPGMAGLAQQPLQRAHALQIGEVAERRVVVLRVAADRDPDVAQRAQRVSGVIRGDDLACEAAKCGPEP